MVSEMPHYASTPATATHSTFHHIVVLLDGSPLAERSLPYLIAVARAGAARLTLLQVLQEPHARIGSRGVDAVEWEMIRVSGQSYLGAIGARLRAHGVESRIELAQGATAEQIMRFATQSDVDLVVMTSHGEGGVSSQWARGSTAQKVIATATTSILVVPTHTDADLPPDAVSLRRILLPLDCSQRAEYILPTASALARANTAELVLAHVVCEPEMPRRRGPSRADIQLAQDVVARNRDEAKRYLREIQNRLASDTRPIQMRLCVGSHRGRALRELAEREATDLVILAAHGSTGDAHQRYGGLATEFLQEGYGPVIILQDLARLAERHEAFNPASSQQTAGGRFERPPSADPQ
jgi:nucleotide-binding universal stress UspA family protein